MIGANDLEASKKFYDAMFATLGVAPAMVDPNGRLFYTSDTGMFSVTKPLDGQPACHANGGTIGFACASPEQVDKWHAAGVAAGGTSCEDPPGVRSSEYGNLYLAYLRDPTGNKLCALHRMA
jgi:catechol 2,3-dioxygenase-like lactoylglutathione lyase family enzyme